MEIRSVVLSPKHIANSLSVKAKKAKEKIKEKKIFKFTKKKIIATSLVLFLGVAVYLNYALFLNDGVSKPKDVKNSSEVSLEKSDSVESFFAQTALDRQRARDEALEVLQTVVGSEEALEDSKQSAMAQMTRIASEIQTESNIESLVMSKGFDDCVAVISDGKCSVVVKSEGLLPNQISQIKEIVFEQAEILPTDVKIIEKK